MALSFKSNPQKYENLLQIPSAEDSAFVLKGGNKAKLLQ